MLTVEQPASSSTDAGAATTETLRTVLTMAVAQNPARVPERELRSTGRMHALPFLIAVLLLVAAVTGAVCAATPTTGRVRRGLLVASIVVGALAITGAALALPALADHVQVKVFVFDPGTAP